MLRRVFRRQRSEKNCSTPETEPWGLKTLATGNDPNIEYSRALKHIQPLKPNLSDSIVAIHGLNGHREKTWSSNGHIWLRDFLPARIPKARIITWGYDANTHGRSEISKQLLYDHAINLITELSRERRVTDVSSSTIKCLLRQLMTFRIYHSFSSIDRTKTDNIHRPQSRRPSAQICSYT